LPIGVTGISVKEVVEMIESRIPGGRYVTSALICLLVLTAATASGLYLYHSLVLPVVAAVSSLLRTGQIASSTIGSMLGSLVGSVILYVSYRYTIKIVLTDYKKVAEGLAIVCDRQDVVGKRIDAIESRISVIED
jgi:hypothetical protein